VPPRATTARAPNPATRWSEAAGRAVDGTGRATSPSPPSAASTQARWPQKNEAKWAATMRAKRRRAASTDDSLYPIRAV
jgi:hypothetical protein